MAKAMGMRKRERGTRNKKASPRSSFLVPRSQLLKWRSRFSSYLARRPHRSFRRTRRRDLPQVPALPGYVAFTASVWRAIWRLRWTYVWLLLIYVTLTVLLIGVVNQGDYQALGQVLRDSGMATITGGNLSNAARTLGVFGAAVTGGLSAPLNEAQQLYMVSLSLYGWLVIVWLLRHYFATNAVPKLRDGFYNAGAPVVPTLMIALISLFQLLPGGLGIFLYILASDSGLLTGGAEQMVFAAGMVLLVLLSLYWLTSTFLAAVIVTIPGTYPMAAIRTAGDVALGRRTSLLLRLLWLMLMVLLLWAVLLIPTILVNDIKPLDAVPLVPLVIQLLTGITLLWSTTYIYLLYRRIVDGIA